MTTYRTKVNVYEINPRDDDESDDLSEYNTDLDLTEFQKALENLDLFDKLKPGDLVVDLSKAGYRMDGVCIVGGDGKLMELAYKPDEYGTIPMCLTCPDKITPAAVLDTGYIPGGDRESPFAWHNNLVPVNLSKFTIEKEYQKNQNKIYICKYDVLTYALVVPYDDFIKKRDNNEIIYFEWSTTEDGFAMISDVKEKIDYILLDPSLL